MADEIPDLPWPDADTFWNGEPCEARQVLVTVADAPQFPAYWARPLVGALRNAVEVKYGGSVFYIDDEPLLEDGVVSGSDGWGWAKVTLGHGLPQYGHCSLEVSTVQDRP